MIYYLLGFGIFVIILFVIGAFHTLSEFKEMEDHPDDYHKDTDHINTKKN